MIPIMNPMRTQTITSNINIIDDYNDHYVEQLQQEELLA